MPSLHASEAITLAKHAKTGNDRRSSGRSVVYCIFSWCLVVLWAAAIFFMSAHTGSDLSTGFFGTVKQWAGSVLSNVFGLQGDVFSSICHFLEYLVLGVLLSNALGRRLSKGKIFLIAVVIASAYGVSDEIHQIFVPDRVCDPADWATDTAGAAVGAAFWALVSRR